MLKPLKIWVQNVLPIVYDDSLSYYEVIAKVSEKTNEIITQTNENTHSIEVLASLFEELGDIDALKALLDEVKVVVEDLYTTDLPKMDGVASAGGAEHAARSDHVHPKDSSKVNVADLFANVTPVMDGAANVGSNTHAARADHRHPTDTSLVKTDEVGYVINGNTSSSSINAGNYVILRNSTISNKSNGLYKCVKAIPAGSTIDASYLGDIITNGGLNDIQNVETLIITPNTNAGWNIVRASAYKIGRLVFFTIVGSNDGTGSPSVYLYSLPENIRPVFEVEGRAAYASASNGVDYNYNFRTSGDVVIQAVPSTGTGNFRISVIYVTK